MRELQLMQICPCSFKCLCQDTHGTTTFSSNIESFWLVVVMHCQVLPIHIPFMLSSFSQYYTYYKAVPTLISLRLFQKRQYQEKREQVRSEKKKTLCQSEPKKAYGKKRLGVFVREKILKNLESVLEFLVKTML